MKKYLVSEEPDACYCVSQSGSENLADGGGGRQQVEAAQSSILLGGKRKEDAGMERAEAAKGVAGVTVEEGYQVEA